MSEQTKKVLVIRKPDRTIHVVELNDGSTVEAALRALSNKLKEGQQWTFEYMDPAEAAKLPPIDPNYKTPAQAVKEVGVLTKAVEEKDAKIAELEALLAAAKGGGAAPPEKLTVPLTIEKINAATTVDEVNAVIVPGEDRKGVLEARDKKIAELEAQ